MIVPGAEFCNVSQPTLWKGPANGEARTPSSQLLGFGSANRGQAPIGWKREVGGDQMSGWKHADVRPSEEAGTGCSLDARRRGQNGRGGFLVYWRRGLKNSRQT